MPTCPKCRKEILPDQQECNECGIIVQKYSAMRNAAIMQAQVLYQNREFQKALKLFEQIQSRFPEISSEIEKTIADIKTETYKIEFQKAVDTFNAKDFSSALSLFRSIQNEYPEHADDVRSYIDESSNKNLADLKKTTFDYAVRHFEGGFYESAKKGFLKLKGTEYQKQNEEYLKKIDHVLGPMQEIERLNLFRSLFDLSFSARAFITIRMMKYLYGFFIIVTCLASVIMIGSGIKDIFKGDFGEGIGAIMGAPIGALLSIVFCRLMLEFIIVIFKIYENLQVVAENSKN